MTIELADVLKILTAAREQVGRSAGPSPAIDAPAAPDAGQGHTYRSVLSPDQAQAFHTLMFVQGHSGDTVGRGQVVDYKPGTSQVGDSSEPHTTAVYDKKGNLLGYTRPNGIYPKSMLNGDGTLKFPDGKDAQNPLGDGIGFGQGIPYEHTFGKGVVSPAPYGYTSDGRPRPQPGATDSNAPLNGISMYAPGQEYGPFLYDPGTDPIETGQASVDGSSGHQVDPTSGHNPHEKHPGAQKAL